MATQSLLLSKRKLSQAASSQPVDESTIREQVLSTHNQTHDGTDFDVKFVLDIVENILNLSMGTAEEVKVEKLKLIEEFNNKQLPFHIKQLTFEIMYGLNSRNLHLTTIHVLNMLSSYPWETKLVLILAAFSIIYAEIYLVFRFRDSNTLALKLTQLKQPPSGLNINQKTVADDCINYVFDLTKCVIELKQTPSYSQPKSVKLALPMACYWVGTRVINCATNCFQFRVQNELTELTTLSATNMLKNIFSSELEKKKAEESYKALLDALDRNSSKMFKMSDVFKLMFDAKDDKERIFRWERAFEDWNGRQALLLITSDFDISSERIMFLNWFYRRSKPYILWIPIVQKGASWTTENEQQFAKLKGDIDFFWLKNPQHRLLPQFIRFITEKFFSDFRIGREPILVSLNPQGRIANLNAIHMILTWSFSFIEKNTIDVQRLYDLTPFITKELKERTSGIHHIIPEIDTMINELQSKIKNWTQGIEKRIQDSIEQSTPYASDKENELWKQETTWSLDLMIGRSDRYFSMKNKIHNWIKNKKCIFLYGGNSVKWIQEFTSKVHEVCFESQLNIELAYVGRNKRIGTIIDTNKLSYYPFDSSYKAWVFWTRLRSMFLSRIRYLLDSIPHFGEECNDEILQGLKKLLTYESKNSTIEGWALLSKGEKVVVCGHGAKMLQVMNDYESWKKNIITKGFSEAFKDHYKMLISSSLNSHSCCALEYPITLNKIPESEKCLECSCCMHKFLTFTCYHGHDVDSNI